MNMNYEEICLLILPYNGITIICRWSTVKATIAEVIRLILVITAIATVTGGTVIRFGA